ncbi:MAG: hypothetical protein JWN34_678 [Bryobacterales bacterium]|nr:hypothetical protein [Bryobacterales bacterium]
MEKLLSSFGLSPLTVPLPPLSLDLAPMDPDELAAALANLGYSGFVHLKNKQTLRNPAEVVARALVHSDLDVRIVEGLPWLLATFVELDWQWLVGQCRLLNLQNRLGFLVELARELGKRGGYGLDAVLPLIEASKLAVEGTLCQESVHPAERNWSLKYRRPEAARWNLATTMSVQDLKHAA